MSLEENITPTWRDFPEFYNNPTIKELGKNQKWTVSTTKSPEGSKIPKKMPLDMYELVNNQKIRGLSEERAHKEGYNPYLTLDDLCEVLPNATNNAYYLDAVLRDKIVVLDIEPSCPQELKEKLLKLPYLYGEISMSGKGVHLIFDLPEEILDKYPLAKNKVTMMDSSHSYEILLNHMVTFTRNALPPSPYEEDISVFEEIFEQLCQSVKYDTDSVNMTVENIDTDDIPNYDLLMKLLNLRQYDKSLKDFPYRDHNGNIVRPGEYDNSVYEYNISRFYYKRLQSMLPNSGEFKDHIYTDSEKAILVYKCVEQAIDHRDKHDTTRNGMPWLLFVASTLIAKVEYYKAEKMAEKELQQRKENNTQGE